MVICVCYGMSGASMLTRILMKHNSINIIITLSLLTASTTAEATPLRYVDQFTVIHCRRWKNLGAECFSACCAPLHIWIRNQMATHARRQVVIITGWMLMSTRSTRRRLLNRKVETAFWLIKLIAQRSKLRGLLMQRRSSSMGRQLLSIHLPNVIRPCLLQLRSHRIQLTSRRAKFSSQHFFYRNNFQTSLWNCISNPTQVDKVYLCSANCRFPS